MISIFILLFSILNFNCDAKTKYIDEYFKIDTILTLKNIEKINTYKNICVNNDSLYILFTDIQNLECIVYHYLINEKIVKNTFSFKYGNTKNIINFVYYDSTFYFLEENYNITKFDSKLKTPNVTHFSKLNYSYEKVDIHNDIIYLTNTLIMSSNKNDDTICKFAYFNAYSENINEKSIEDPDGLPYLLFKPNNIIDFSGNNILVSDIISYNLKLLNLNFDGVCLYRNPNLLNKFKYKINIDLKRSYLKNIIAEYRNSYKLLNTINSVNFINDSTILVRKSLPNGDNIYNRSYIYDIIKYSQNNLSQIHSNLENKEIKPNDKFIEKFILPIKLDYIIKNNNLIYIDDIPISLYDSSTYKEKYEEINNYLFDNDLNYSIIIRKYTND